MKGVVLRTLRAIDWDFATPRLGYLAPPHWYPGTFLPALSEALLEALTPVGGTIFDPYGGIGTSGWSALRKGRSCHIADVNPVALLVSYATNSLLALTRIDKASANNALGALGRLVGRNDDLFGERQLFSGVAHLDDQVQAICTPEPNAILNLLVVGEPQWSLLENWIEPSTLANMNNLTQAILASQSAYLRLLGLCMISAIARSVCSQHASWGHIADNVRPREMTAQNLYAATTRWLKRTKAFISAPMTQVSTERDIAIKPRIYLRDWSKPADVGPGDADLLLTSPPYADAIDYTLAQRLSLYFLGYDDRAISSLVSAEIGARRKRSKTLSRSTWSEQLCAALKDQVTWVKPSGTICLVLPHKDSGRSSGEDDIRTSLEGMGWHLFFEADRSIHQSHTRHSWTSIKKETILVFSSRK
ncbi:hypothetical protein M2323_004449 [Rhodoblastus acidophilus]|uniref:hypothetical protein n=1 Tax=Rhodoblastus acidophilus TaxID=1074 RepID=UPI0022258D2D|nr:hypothetical protein [Rhodoblastus acidophilus]MCW2286680.1 hypothetical protein [Rhodoblastus acidophilus]MCW2335500.1 hypothetical protein [Rhodoblastus acidophilus]